jgi:hypothetical protein
MKSILQKCRISFLSQCIARVWCKMTTSIRSVHDLIFLVLSLSAAAAAAAKQILSSLTMDERHMATFFVIMTRDIIKCSYANFFPRSYFSPRSIFLSLYCELSLLFHIFFREVDLLAAHFCGGCVACDKATYCAISFRSMIHVRRPTTLPNQI